MKRILVILIAVFLIHSLGEAQNVFSKIYECSIGDYPRDVCETYDHGFLVVGDHRIIKTDQSGDTLWTRTYGNNNGGTGYYIGQTSEKAYMIMGSSSTTDGKSQTVFTKINEKGEVIWTKPLEGIELQWNINVERTNDNGLLLLGIIRKDDPESYSPYLVKINSLGELVWTKTLSCKLDLWTVRDFRSTSDGGYTIAGSTFDYNGGELGKVFFIKINSDGIEEWRKVYSEFHDNCGLSVRETPSGGYCLAGITYGSYESPYLSKMMMSQTDHLGNVLVNRVFSTGSSSSGYAFDSTPDGGNIFAGITVVPGVFGACVYVIKTNSVCDTLWTKWYESPANGTGDIIKNTTDSGYIVAGHTFESGRTKIFMLKIDKDGNTAGSPDATASERENRLKVFPNPINDVIHIQRNESSKVMIEIVDLQGRQIYKKMAAAQLITIDMHSYPEGPYILKMSSDSKIEKAFIVKRKN